MGLMIEDHPEGLSLRITSVEDQEVKHIAEIREWLSGKKQSLRIIYNELASTDRMLYFGSYHRELDLAKLPWEDPAGVDPAVIERIIDWTLQQPEEVQALIFQFLDAEDREAELPIVLDSLGLVVDSNSNEKVKSTKMSMAQIMRNALPATKDELIVLIQRVSPETKRPAARVRQFLRENTRNGSIHLGDDGKYRLAK